MMNPKGAFAVNRGIENVDKRCQPQPDTGLAIFVGKALSHGRRNDELSATTTASSYSSSKPSSREPSREGRMAGSGETKLKKENLLGTCVSFREKDEFSETTSDSQPGSHGVSEASDNEADSIDDRSEEALMAVIAAATTRKEETNYTAFFATAEAQAIAAVEQQMVEEELDVQECKQEGRDSQGMRVVDDLFQRIEQQIDIPGASGSKTMNVTEVLHDLERVLFFTDVIDRNPAPPSSSIFGATFNTSALIPSSISPWWEAKVREVSDAVYKSSLDIYNELERTGNEVQRVVLFTDVPDGIDMLPRGSNSAGGADLMEVLSACSSESTKIGVLVTTFSGEGTHQEAEAEAESQGLTSQAQPKFPQNTQLQGEATAKLDSFHQELGRFFKGLEQKLLFTDLPDVPVPRPPTTEQSATGSMTLSHTTSCHSSTFAKPALNICKVLEQKLLFTDLPDVPLPTSADRSATVPMTLVHTTSGHSSTPTKSVLDMCRGKNAMLAQILTEQEEATFTSSEMRRRLEKCIKDSPESQQPPEEKDIRSMERGLTTSAKQFPSVGADSSESVRESESESLAHSCKIPATVFAVPQLSDLTSSFRGSHRTHRTFNTESGCDPRGYATRFSEKHSCKIDDHAAAILKADSSTEKSVRLLVEVEVSKSLESLSSEFLIQNGAVPSDLSTTNNRHEGETVGAGDIENARGKTNGKGLVSTWTTKDDQRLTHIIDSMTSEEIKNESLRGDSVGVETVEVQDDGTFHEENSKADSDAVSWGECVSSLADTFATAEQNSFSKHRDDYEKRGRHSSVPQAFDTTMGRKETTDDIIPRETAASQLSPATITGSDTFDVLLAEMRDLESAINKDLQKAHKVLCKTVHGTYTSK